MKKIFTLMLLALATLGTKADEYVVYQPSSPESVYYTSDQDNHQPTVKFPFIKAGDVIKIHYTNVSSECSIIWRGKTSGDWKWESIGTGSNGILSYTVPSSDQTYASETCTPDEIVASLKDRGLTLTGKFNLLAITVDNNSQLSNTSQTLLTGQSTDLGNWGTEVSLASYDFSTAKVGDMLNITYTSYNTLSNEAWATIQLQSKTAYGSVTAYSQITDKCSQGTQSTNTQQTLNITVDETILTALQKGYAIIKGGNVYLNSLTITSSNNILINTLFSEDCAFGSWENSYSTNDSKYFTTAVAGDILSIAYNVSEGNSGELQLIDTSNNWQKYSDNYAVSGLSGEGTTNFIIDEALLAKLQAGNIAIKGAGNITGKGVYLKTFNPTKAGYRPVYIPASGYATFYGESTCALPAGVEAYYVSGTTETSATLTTLSYIPASQGVILKGAEGIYQLYTTNETAASVTNNKLTGATTQTTMSGDGNYILYNNSGTPEFRKATADSKLDAYKAYLPASNIAGAPSLSISFDGMGNATGISNVQKTVVEDNRIYNLNGQEVKNAGKGIFIKNGKKYIIK